MADSFADQAYNFFVQLVEERRLFLWPFHLSRFMLATMLSVRTLILTFGPLIIVAGAYWLAMPHDAQGRSRQQAVSSEAFPIVERREMRHESLGEACQQAADRLKPSLSADCRIVVRIPFVLAGDLTRQKLAQHYRETIVPTARALSVSYFDRLPDEPIIVLMFSDESSYRAHAQRLDGSTAANYHGYYQKSSRRILLNISTGTGTLAHELTHALAHFDFPQMPEWFDEGLASLHEQSEFSDDGFQLLGQSNWRLHYLRPADQRGRLRSLESLMTSPGVRQNEQAVDYAHSRYLCLYLQRRGLLRPFYRKFRGAVAKDSTGVATLRSLLDTETLAQFDQKFRVWLLTADDSVR